MKYYVLFMLCLAAIIAYVQRQALIMCDDSILDSLQIDYIKIGRIAASWQLGYALMQLPSGWLADRIGSRRSLALFMVVWSGFLGVASWCTTYSSMIVVWGLMGMAQAGVFPCSTKMIGDRFGATLRATASGFLASSMALGSALAPLLTTQMLAAGMTWQSIFTWYVVPGWMWAILFLFSTSNTKSNAVHPVKSNVSEVALRDIRWIDFLSSGSMWLLCGQQFFRAAAMMFFQTWFPTFLRETRGVDLADSGKLAFVVGIGALFGGMLGGISSDRLLARTGNRRLARQGIAVIGMLSCGCLVGLSYFIKDTSLAIGCISVGAFLATFGGVSGYTMAIDFGGRYVATTFSVMNMCGNIGAALFPLIVGHIAVSSFGWSGVLFLSAIIFVIDAICWALLNPTHTISGESLKYEKS